MSSNFRIWSGLLVLLFACFLGSQGCYSYATSDSVVIVVNKTERVTVGRGKSVASKYLVFTDGETFENTDAIWYWKWNSSDIHGRLEPGKAYRVKCYGWRIPILSVYRNIVSAEEV